jgi:hypothetical protein
MNTSLTMLHEVQNGVFQKPSKNPKISLQPSFPFPFSLFPPAKGGLMERANGIEPSSLAWEAKVIPLYDARVPSILAHPASSEGLITDLLAILKLQQASLVMQTLP